MHVQSQSFLIKKACPHSFPYLIITAGIITFISIIVINLSRSYMRKPRLEWLNELPKSIRLMSPELGNFQEFSSGLPLSLLGPCFSSLCSYHSFWPMHRPTLWPRASSNHQKATCWQESTSRMGEARKSYWKQFEPSNHWQIFETKPCMFLLAYSRKTQSKFLRIFLIVEGIILVFCQS